MAERATTAEPNGRVGARTSANRPPKGGRQAFPVVRVGASAAGLDAFKRLLTSFSDDTGMALVLIQHLDPDHESLMADLLARHTKMTVLEAGDDMAIQPNHVFIIPPGKFIRIANDRLVLDQPITRRGLRMPIDHFFRSLAEARGDQAIGVVLSGTGSDGTLGLKEIKGAGGMAMAQTPETAEYDGMPRSAVAAGIVDFSLPIEAMAEVICNHVRHPLIGGRVRQATSEELATSREELQALNEELSTVNRQLEARARQQAAVAELGALGLAGGNLGALLRQVCRTVQETLHADFTKILEMQQDRTSCLLRAGMGWRRGLVGKAVVGIGADCQAGFTLLSSSPVIVEDLRREQRFRGPALLFDHGVISGLSVRIGPAKAPWGVLGVHCKSERKMTPDDVNFAQAVANIIYAASVRQEAEAALRENRRQLTLVLDAAAIGTWSWQVATDRQDWDDRQRAIMGWPKGRPVPSGKDFFGMIHTDDRTRVEAALETIMTGAQNELHDEFRLVLPDRRTIWMVSRSRAVRDPSGRVTRIAGVTFDTTRRKTDEQALHDSEERLRLALSAGRMARFDWDLATDERVWSEGLERALGLKPAGSVPTRDSWHGHIEPADRDHVDQRLKTAIAERAPFRAEYRIRSTGGEDCWIEDRGVLSYDADGQALHMSGLMIDITERRQAERRQQLLIAELDHRVKNVLANIGAMACQSKASADTIDGYIDALEGRIHALAAAQNLSSQNHGRGVSLAELVEEGLAGLVESQPGCVSMSGEDVLLEPTAVQSLVLAIHELATNAAKYGALSMPRGRVDLAWTVTSGKGSRSLRLRWREIGGPAVIAPTRSGFGMTVINDFLASDLDASVALTFAEEGVVCEIELPATQLIDPTATDKIVLGSGPNTLAVTPPASRRRILVVVEDSSTVCRDIEAALLEQGYDMVGPARSVANANALLDSETVDAVILDLNLDGESAVPIAERLHSASIPYLLATSHDAKTVLPAHLKSKELVRKPYRRVELIEALQALFSVH